MKKNIKILALAIGLFVLVMAALIIIYKPRAEMSYYHTMVEGNNSVISIYHNYNGHLPNNLAVIGGGMPKEFSVYFSNESIPVYLKPKLKDHPLFDNKDGYRILFTAQYKKSTLLWIAEKDSVPKLIQAIEPN